MKISAFAFFVLVARATRPSCGAASEKEALERIAFEGSRRYSQIVQFKSAGNTRAAQELCIQIPGMCDHPMLVRDRPVNINSHIVKDLLGSLNQLAREASNVFLLDSIPQFRLDSHGRIVVEKLEYSDADKFDDYPGSIDLERGDVFLRKRDLTSSSLVEATLKGVVNFLKQSTAAVFDLIGSLLLLTSFTLQNFALVVSVRPWWVFGALLVCTDRVIGRVSRGFIQGWSDRLIPLLSQVAAAFGTLLTLPIIYATIPLLYAGEASHVVADYIRE